MRRPAHAELVAPDREPTDQVPRTRTTEVSPSISKASVKSPTSGCCICLVATRWKPKLPTDPGLSVLTYSAEPGSPSEEAMRDLARWSETRSKLSAARAGSET